MDTHTLSGVERYFYDKIPLTLAMGLRVEASDDSKFVVTAPLSENYNHLGTAFGGSLSAIAMIAGYGFLFQQLPSNQGHVVVREANIKYLKPLTHDIRATCHRPEESALEKFQKKFAKVGRASIELRVTIEDEGRIAVEFTGSYVAIS